MLTPTPCKRTAIVIPAKAGILLIEDPRLRGDDILGCGDDEKGTKNGLQFLGRPTQQILPAHTLGAGIVTVSCHCHSTRHHVFCEGDGGWDSKQ